MRRVLFILGQLSDSDVDWLAKNGRRERFSSGVDLITAGKGIDALYIVLDGELAVKTPAGERLARVAAGDMLGEMSLIDSGLPATTVAVERETSVLVLPMSTLRAKLDQDIGFAARFYKALSLFLADRMRNTIRHMGYKNAGGEAVDVGEIDEIDIEVLDKVHLAGARFERMLKTLAG